MPTGTLPASGKKLWERVYDEALKGSCKGDKQCAAGSAWKAVKNAGWKKDADGKWHKSATFETFALNITRASLDKATGEMRWKASASDTGDDLYGDNMTLELFEDFIERIETSEAAPEEFRSAFWVGGMPYLSVSHYPDLDGKAVPGTIDRVFIDGNYLKSEGTFNDTPLGRAAFKSVLSDLYGENKDREDKVRISIAFIDWKHKHKDSGVVFERKSLDDICLECFKNLFRAASEEQEPHPTNTGAKEFLAGQLIHEAMTRVPVNTRTLMEVERAMTTRKEDAESIIGELAEELDEQAKLVGKSQALVIKAEEEMECAENESEEDCRKRQLSGKITEAEPGMELAPSKSEAETPEIEEIEEAEEAEILEEEADEIKIFAILSEIKSMIAPKSEAHPLDPVFAEFKSQFDAHVASGASEDEILVALQEPYSKIGETIKSLVHPKEEVVVKSSPDNVVDTLAQTVQQLAQQVNLITTKLGDMNKPPTEVVVPPRRSIDPKLTLQKSQVEQVKSSTPSLRKLIERTTN